VREFHHVGIPTEKKRDKEAYLQDAKLYVTDAADSPYGIEWLRFEPDSPLPKQLKTGPHVAFKVADLEAELRGKDVLLPPFSPMKGLKVAFILHEGVPIEFMQMG
jgi:hypothetical protein